MDIFCIIIFVIFVNNLYILFILSVLTTYVYTFIYIYPFFHLHLHSFYPLTLVHYGVDAISFFFLYLYLYSFSLFLTHSLCVYVTSVSKWGCVAWQGSFTSFIAVAFARIYLFDEGPQEEGVCKKVFFFFLFHCIFHWRKRALCVKEWERERESWVVSRLCCYFLVMWLNQGHFEWAGSSFCVQLTWGETESCKLMQC